MKKKITQGIIEFSSVFKNSGKTLYDGNLFDCLADENVKLNWGFNS